MQTSGFVEEQIDKQATLASAARESISDVNDGTSARHLRPRAVLDLLEPYSTALYIAQRVVHADTFNVELVQALHSKLLPLEKMVDDVLAAAKRQAYFDDADTACPLHWLEICDEQVKDCMVALEAMLDPHLDDLMAATAEEYRRGETVSLESIR